LTHSSKSPRRSDADATHAERRRFVEDAVHSGEMEGLPVTSAFDADAAAYVNGSITLEEFSDRVRARLARVDGAMGAAGHIITDPVVRGLLRKQAAGENRRRRGPCADGSPPEC
jgi:hypothetical protein